MSTRPRDQSALCLRRGEFSRNLEGASIPPLSYYGGFMLVDPEINGVVAGSRFELSAEEVVNYCMLLREERA